MTDKREKFYLGALVLLALCIRLVFLLDSRFVIDADEAIVGLMAKHISEGTALPVFYYGQHYMGALEGYVAALFFLVIGNSPIVLQLVPLTFSLLVVLSVFYLARAVAGSRAGYIAGCLAAVPPPAFLIWSMKARGGFIEIVLLGAIAMLLAHRWLCCDSGKLSRVGWVGFVCGIGWWVNNQILYFMVAISLSATAVYGKQLLVDILTRQRTFAAGIRNLGSVILVGISAFLVGGTGFWLYNIANGFPSLAMFESVGSSGFLEQLGGVLSRALPALMGARRFWHTTEIFPGATIVVCCLLTIFTYLSVALRKDKFFLSKKGVVAFDLNVFLFLSCCIIFASSSYGWLVSAPRYLLPIYVPLFVLTGVGVHFLAGRSRLGGLSLGCFVIIFNIWCLFAGGKAIPGQPLVFGRGRVPIDNKLPIRELLSRDIRKVRATYWVGYRLAFESQEHISFVMIGSPYKVRIPDYELCDDPNILPLLLVKREAKVVVPALSRLGYSFKREQVGEYVLVSEISSLFGNAELLDKHGMRSTSNVSSQLSPQLAIDGDDTTRWGTGQPQSKGQELTIDFSSDHRISGVVIRQGQWKEDFPRSLSVRLVSKSGSVSEVLSGRESEGVHFLHPRSDFAIRFPTQSVSGVKLLQNGTHNVFDWSIAEVDFLGDPVEK